MPVNGTRGSAPRRDRLYTIVAWISRWQLSALMGTRSRHRRLRLVFAAVMGALALGTITAASIITKLPLLFPPLAPSAFILFTTPLSPAAAPRSVVLGHAIAVAAGVASLMLTRALFPGAGLDDPAVVNAPRGVAIFLAMGTATAALKLTRCNHPPATASALLASMGLFDGWAHAFALISAAVLLVAEAWLLLRILGGLPYPLWRSDTRVARRYGRLAGLWHEPEPAWDPVRTRAGGRNGDIPLPGDAFDEILQEIAAFKEESTGSSL